MKKLFTFVLSISLIAVLAACGDKNAAPATPAAEGASKEVTLKIGASAVPHAEILNFIKPKLKEQGVILEVKEFSDYVQPNIQVFEKQLDANFFQHLPYLEAQNADRKMNLESIVGVHLEPFGAYSKKITNIKDLADGATVAVPNDPSNAGRALALLEKNGLIKLKDGVGIKATLKDIVDNPKKLKINELDAAMLPRTLADVDLSLINTNYALQANLVPTKDALFIEDKNSPYTNIIVARPDNKDSAAIKKLIAALTTPEVKTFIEDKYKGSIIPSF
ncbi:MetQ/NlpA family ABC transporter substrate-binding protein [Paenibacillus sp. N1-5-1-14]|uniref:MetQ/NlpA family ABC transporter substrate-binding protein n=1 Tax=Paenibacillus radicibacter TaxID=2972488 RepID=UPI002158E149|nr:MetQ/NlpA family ABC transporter substrate-binding protein [Paenibacillus radicibacter]MCR8642068.1 MetQ/NlpA family ABC transporter substrate-binding protein [Paenibacillus radicibacter]